MDPTQTSDASPKRSKTTENLFSESALRNELILHNILKFVPYSDLLSTRQVNRDWNDASQKYFKSKGWFAIKLGNEDEIIDLEPKIQEIAALSHFSVNFKITQKFQDYEYHYPLNTNSEYSQQIVKCISSKSNSIRSLKLDCSLTTDRSTNFSLLTTVLKSAPQLGELVLSIDITSRAISNEYWLRDFSLLEPLCLLKTFRLRFPCWELEAKYLPKLKTLFRKFLYLTPNMEIFEAKHNQYADHPCKMFINIYFEEMQEIQMKWKNDNIKSNEPMPFQNLQSFTIPLNNVEKLLGLKKQKIKNLTIFAFAEDLQETAIPDLLNMHAITLEKFSFNFTIFAYSQHDLEMQIQNIDFPHLPNLKSLEFNLKRYPKYRDARANCAFNLLDLFVMGGQRLQEKFPKLKSFSWELDQETFSVGAYRDIFPLPNQDASLCFPQFTTVNVSGFYSHPHENCTEEAYKEWMIWLATIFPNVHNPTFNNARHEQSDPQLCNIGI